MLRQQVYFKTLLLARLWKELSCPSKDEWIKKIWFIQTMEYYSAFRKDEYPTFATAWMELEGITLSEISQSEKNSYHTVSRICGT